MKLDYVPLLRVQWELHALPRGIGRFRHYLCTIWGDEGPDEALVPLLMMNPMGNDHVAALLDALLAMDADGLGAHTAAEAAAVLSYVPGECKIALVVADDLKGGWTNRFDYEFTLRFGTADPRDRGRPAGPIGADLPRWLKHFWLTVLPRRGLPPCLR
jgi:hypothetical protein